MTIQSLWIGELSVAERLCIASFLQNGHDFHLYSYDRPALPSGVELHDANEIVPKDRISEFPSLAEFADYFRLYLLLKNGGWWLDMDYICLKPIPFEDDYAFFRNDGGVTNSLFCAPKGSDFMQHVCQEVEKINPRTSRWGDLGSHILNPAVSKFSLDRYIHPSHLYGAIHWSASPGEFLKVPAPTLPSDAFATHLANQMWKRAGKDKNERYPADCLYEILKARYL